MLSVFWVSPGFASIVATSLWNQKETRKRRRGTSPHSQEGHKQWWIVSVAQLVAKTPPLDDYGAGVTLENDPESPTHPDLYEL